MTTDSSAKFRSPYRDINLVTLRELCDVHPWTLGEMCRHVGVDQSVLSMVFSGKRPLPTSIAKQFLGLLGMQVDGSLDIDHAFVFAEKRSNENTLNALLDRMYPEKAGVVWLRRDGIASGNQSRVDGSPDVWALYDGRIASVIHGTGGSVTQKWKGSEAWTLKDFDTPPKLLSTDELPSKVEILKAFAYSKFPSQLTWNDVSKAAERRKLNPYDVLKLISTHHPLTDDA